MKIEEQVCSLEQAKRIRDFGVNQIGYFSWFGDETMRLMENGGCDPVIYGPWIFVIPTEPANSAEHDHREDVCIKTPLASAFTVSELGLMLGYGAMCHPRYDNEAIHRADLLISDLENGITSARQVNDRMK